MKHKKLIIIASTVLIAFLVPLIVFQTRAPVLIVAEEAFVGLYGAERIKNEAALFGLAMFRRLKMVVVANDAGDDIVPHAVAEVSPRPFCVLFPLRFSRAAQAYTAQNPHVPVVLLQGRDIAANKGLKTFSTDIEADFYRAGLAADAISPDGKIVVLADSRLLSRARAAFVHGMPPEKASEVRFYSFLSQFVDDTDISCVVLAGVGGEFFERHPEIPVISFSWLDITLMPSNVFLIIDDSPLAQAVEAARLAVGAEGDGDGEGKIRSKFHVQNADFIDRRTLRKIKNIGKNVEFSP